MRAKNAATKHIPFIGRGYPHPSPRPSDKIIKKAMWGHWDVWGTSLQTAGIRCDQIYIIQ